MNYYYSILRNLNDYNTFILRIIKSNSSGTKFKYIDIHLQISMLIKNKCINISEITKWFDFNIKYIITHKRHYRKKWNIYYPEQLLFENNLSIVDKNTYRTLFTSISIETIKDIITNNDYNIIDLNGLLYSTFLVDIYNLYDNNEYIVNIYTCNGEYSYKTTYEGYDNIDDIISIIKNNIDNDKYVFNENTGNMKVDYVLVTNNVFLYDKK